MSFLFFHVTATTAFYTLSLHDALPILLLDSEQGILNGGESGPVITPGAPEKSRLIEAINYGNPDLIASMSLLFSGADRKSTRLNSSHANISYAVFCLKKKKTK